MAAEQQNMACMVIKADKTTDGGGKVEMTIKEFAVKYTLPYHVAYKASFHVKPVESIVRDRDYDEKELCNEIIRYCKRRLREIKAQYEQYADSIRSLRETK